MHRPTVSALAAAVLAVACGAAHAVAGSASLEGWTVTGDAIARDGALVVTTAFLADGDPDAPFNLSGQAAAGIGEVEAGAGIDAYALDLAPPDFATEGSVLGQRFDATAGQTLSFDWSFSTREDVFEDHAFAVVNGQVFTLATRSGAVPGTQHFSLALPGGQVTLAIGVVDTGDVLGVSSLTVSSLQVSAVPEPASAALLMLGLGALGGMLRRGPAA